MINIRRALSVSAAAAALSLVLSVSAFAATGRINFTDPTAMTDSEVEVTMKITADDDAKLQDATVTVQYPADKLEFISGTDASGGAGTVRIHGSGSGSGASTIEYVLRFKTLQAGTFTVNVDTREVYDENGAAVELSHVGSSTITVAASAEASTESALSVLEVSPGTLEPAFAADVYEYSITVGTGVGSLAVNAIAADNGASVKILNNESLADGDNDVVIAVTAADGQTSAEYHIDVYKVEGGPENAAGQSEQGNDTENGGEAEPETEENTVEGVELYSRSKTITIMNPSDDVQIPEGFKAGTISIDGQKVKGWVWGASENPEYCVVYGMNDKGEINFYRYDMSEKTIQRYFEDPISADSVSNTEYTELEQQLAEYEEAYAFRFTIICILAVIAVVLLVIVIYLSTKLGAVAKEHQRRESHSRRRGASQFDDGVDQDILKHDYDAEGAEDSDSDEDDELGGTRVIKRSERKRRNRREVSDMTMVIPRRRADAQSSDFANDAGADDNDDNDAADDDYDYADGVDNADGTDGIDEAMVNPDNDGESYADEAEDYADEAEDYADEAEDYADEDAGDADDNEDSYAETGDGDGAEADDDDVKVWNGSDDDGLGHIEEIEL